jgi:transcriptional regulator with XRE-family HTH domain
MPKRPDPKVQERNAAIIDAWKQGTKAHQLAKQFGLSDCAITQIIRRAGAKRNSDEFQPQERQTGLRKPRLSQIHVRVGQLVSNYRIFEAKISITEMAHRLQMSVRRLSELEQGVYDPGLSELIRISNEIKQDVTHLLTTPQFKVGKGSETRAA